MVRKVKLYFLCVTALLGSVFVLQSQAQTESRFADGMIKDPCCREESYQLRHPALIGFLDGIRWIERSWPDDLKRSSYSSGYEEAFLAPMVAVTKPAYLGWRRVGQVTSASILLLIVWKSWKKRRG